MTDSERLQWFTEAKLGVFIHWGLYSLLAGEWEGKIMRGNGYAEQINSQMKIPNRDYARTAESFNPVSFSAEEWVRMIKEAGASYLVFTTKHQDGFSMFSTKHSDYNIVDSTPFGKDPLLSLSEACRKYGVRLGLYYSHARDHHEPGANWNTHGNSWDFPAQTEKDFEHYFHSKVIPQVSELLAGYGAVSLMWFDVPYQIPERLSRELRKHVLDLQPNCLINSRIGNNCGDYLSMGDNVVPEKVILEPWESCVTMNDTWGYSKHDHHWKPAETIVRIFKEVTTKGGNLLLNVGPDGGGQFPKESIALLKNLAPHSQRRDA
ncbi:MAG: alpha-L-fucosidase [Spirochaetia bacterium]|nr:alpha-L-fucosidase [Spirochaetia bacterium]